MPQPIADELKSIPMSSNLGQSLERAHGFARAQSHRSVTLEHLLLALTEDPEAAIILQSANVELARLSTEVSGYLGGLLEDMRGPPGMEPRPDPELLRVLQAAASAAHQSRRRQIDGAIVLAAIVGDGKSPAAGLLKALGMTFEEAIRALQRANAKARLQPKPAGAPQRPDEVADGTSASESALETGPAVASAGLASSAPLSLPPAPTAEEILAAARARIQQRAARQPDPPASASDAPAETAPVAGAPPAAPELAPAPPAETLSSAIEAAMETPTRRVEPSVRPPPAAASPRVPQPVPQPAEGLGRWAPPERPQSAALRTLSATPPGHEASRTLPPPRSAPPPMQRSTRWSDIPMQGGPANGEIAALGRAGPLAARPREPWARQGQHRGPPHAERGPLLESIPRRMRALVAVTGEVRIARDKVDALMQALAGPPLHRPGAQLTRTLCVRLRAPNGGFTIEALTPETQWIEGAAAIVHDETVLWRWSIVPQRRGRGRLLLTLSARTITGEAIGAESAPPDRVIDVRIGRNYARLGTRLVTLLSAITAGVLLGRYGEQAIDAAVLLLKQMLLH